MTKPLVPADVDLKDFAYLPLDAVRLRDSDLATLASGDGFRAAVLLWCAAWHQRPAASLPADDRLLAKLAGYGRDVAEWSLIRGEALRGFVECDDGRLYHPVLAEKAIEAWEAKQLQRNRTRSATQARTGKPGAADQDIPPQPRHSRDDERDDPRDDDRHVDRNVHQGKGREEKGMDPPAAATGASAREDADPVPGCRPPEIDLGKVIPLGREPFEAECRALMIDLPVNYDRDFGPIRALVDEGVVTRADVLAGLADARAKADRAPKTWDKLAGWCERARDDRLTAAHEARAGPARAAAAVKPRKESPHGPDRSASAAARRQHEAINRGDDPFAAIRARRLSAGGGLVQN